MEGEKEGRKGRRTVGQENKHSNSTTRGTTRQGAAGARGRRGAQGKNEPGTLVGTGGRGITSTRGLLPKGGGGRGGINYYLNLITQIGTQKWCGGCEGQAGGGSTLWGWGWLRGTGIRRAGLGGGMVVRWGMRYGAGKTPDGRKTHGELRGPRTRAEESNRGFRPSKHRGWHNQAGWVGWCIRGNRGMDRTQWHRPTLGDTRWGREWRETAEKDVCMGQCAG